MNCTQLCNGPNDSRLSNELTSRNEFVLLTLISPHSHDPNYFHVALLCFYSSYISTDFTL